MKDFDATRTPPTEDERKFLIGGVEFRRRSGVRPEVLASFDGIQKDSNPGTVIGIIDKLIVDMILPEDVPKWRELRDREEDPVTLFDLNSVAEWLVEQEADRPTKQPEASSLGLGPTGTSSTEDSSSPATPAPTPLASVSS